MFKATKVRYDAEKNIVIVDVGEMQSTVTEVEIPFPIIKKALPATMSKAEKIAELQRMIHDIRKEKLLNSHELIKELKRLSKGLEASRNKLEKAGSKNDITKWRHMVQSWVGQKNIVKEFRLAGKQLNDEEARLELESAKLRTGE